MIMKNHDASKTCPSILEPLYKLTQQNSLSGYIPNSRLLIKALTAIVWELQARGTPYKPCPEERVLLRTMLRRTHNRFKSLHGCEETIDEFVDRWLAMGTPHADWMAIYDK